MEQNNIISILQKRNKIEGIWINNQSEAELITKGLNNFSDGKWSSYNLDTISVDGDMNDTNDNIVSVLIDKEKHYTVKVYINDERQAIKDMDRLNADIYKGDRYQVQTLREWYSDGDK